MKINNIMKNFIVSIDKFDVEETESGMGDKLNKAFPDGFYWGINGDIYTFSEEKYDVGNLVAATNLDTGEKLNIQIDIDKWEFAPDARAFWHENF